MEFGLHSGITACTGAEVNILADGTFGIRVVQISLQKKLVQILSKKEYTLGINQIKTIDIHGPVAITLTGKGVLIKKSAVLETVTEQSLRNLFPSYKPEEFYVQHFRSAAYSFVAFVRKEIADSLISAFKKQGAEILLLGLGPFVTDHILTQLNHYAKSLNFDGHQLSLDEDKAWIDYAYEQGARAGFDLKIDIEPIPEQFVLSYAAAFQLLLNDRLELITVESEEFKNDLLEATAKLKFKQIGTLVLFFFFLILLLNFLLFSYYNAANQELAGKVGQRSDRYTDRQKLEAEVKEKEAQVKLIGWNRGIRYAYLCDQIGQTVPAAVSLSELSMDNSIRISGQSANVYIVHDWIYALKKEPWVKGVQLEKYATDDQKEAQVFTLNVKY
ncbi:Fimbrial assembly protein (PilN) [Pedobacter westerhofensis]|uniref:Fimbrial assembly protein (PilN) n=1 Tax=Pedobacter westerhofensis TaxID=425512 RepID=A0A521C8W8_9SPHI|nr:PilN domain-containing protein [Pedobacter westerhofensis]SMO55160.1 Fimbrial assembly protein (PilN) [Pedobacter westerhofensis]